MAEEKDKKPKESKHEEHKGGEHKVGKKDKKKLHLHSITTTRAKDGSFIHEHTYKDHPDDVHSRPPVFAGTSQIMEDLHAHMDDHFGDGEQQAEPDGDEAAQPSGGEEPAAAEQ